MISFPVRSVREKREVSDWYDAIRILRTFDTQSALERARLCSHPDAKWFASLFAGVESVDALKMEQTFLAQASDARGLFFASILRVVTQSRDEKCLWLKASAEMGYAPAQNQIACTFPSTDVNFRHWVERAVAQGDRDGLFHYGWVLYNDLGRKGAALGLVYIKEAAELGHARAQEFYAETFGEHDWRRYFWFANSSKIVPRLQACRDIASGATKCLDMMNDLSTTTPLPICRALFEIGRICKDAVDVDLRTLYGADCTHVEVLSLCRAMALYDAWCQDAKEAIFCWILVGRTFGVVKDIRRVIARHLWKKKSSWSKRGSPKTQTRPVLFGAAFKTR